MIEGDETILGPVVRVNRSPLQMPDHDEHIRTEVYGGPESKRDQRLILSRAELAILLEMARDSPTGRVVIEQAGLEVKFHRAKSGHPYTTWRLLGIKPKPERIF